MDKIGRRITMDRKDRVNNIFSWIILILAFIAVGWFIVSWIRYTFGAGG
jgi:t-SNARE complex subunit (syntaxin)